MRIGWNGVILTAILGSTQCIAFHAPAVVRSRTGTTTTSIFASSLSYTSNTTGTEYEQAHANSPEEYIYSDGVVETDEQPAESTFYNDDLANGYYDDGTSYYMAKPTLEILKAWTMEYIDGIDLAGGFMTRISVGVEMMLSSDFVFTSPSIGPINKNDYVNLMKYYNTQGLDLASAVPDLKVTYEGWHQDPHEPWRVWAIARYSGTHTGVAVEPNSGMVLSPPNNGVQFTTGPELHSFLWTADKKILWQTMGYAGDSYTGSNQGYGGLDGLLVSMGLPRLYLKAMGPLISVQSWVSQFKESGPKTRSSYSYLPHWWHKRKTFELNIHV